MERKQASQLQTCSGNVLAFLGAASAGESLAGEAGGGTVGEDKLIEKGPKGRVTFQNRPIIRHWNIIFNEITKVVIYGRVCNGCEIFDKKQAILADQLFLF